ncbi:hypothetical protein NU195Hw_Modified_233t1 [Hortaea werneckii]
MSSAESTASNNALSVFNEAISSFAKASATDVVDSSTSDATTTSDSSSAPSTSQTVESSSSSTSSDPTTSTTFSRSTAQTSTAQTSFSTSPPTSSTLRTVASQTTSLSGSAKAAETAGAGPPLSSQEKLQDGPIAGIATGAAAGVVLVLLIALFCLRRRKQNKMRRGSDLPSRSNSQRVFPEVAWLYDPKTSGKDHSHSYQEVKQISSRQTSPERSPDPSTALLVPEPRDGAVEMPSAPPSPNMRASNSSEPLLAPGPTLFPSNRGSTETLRYSAELRSASQSPVRKVRNSMHSSRTDLQRPMSAIYENVPTARPNYEAREGLLAPPDGRGLEVWHER